MATTPTTAACKLRYDPEYWAAVKHRIPANPPPASRSVLEIRARSDPILAALFRALPYPPDVQETKFEVESLDGTRFDFVRFATAEQAASAEPLPAVVMTHGGGLVSGSVEIFAPQIARYVAQAGVQYWAVDYRLAPEHPGPAGVEDCFAALQWLSRRAAEFNVDPARIAVFGDSAGGNIAAGAALMARDAGLDPPLAKQILVYPMLDDRTTTRYPADWPALPFLTWKAEENAMAWDAYVGAGKRGKPEADVSPYAAPARAASLAGLPPTYIDVGGLDLFRDECVEYAARLARENVEVEFHLYPGVPHGFESAWGITVVKAALENRGRSLRSF